MQIKKKSRLPVKILCLIILLQSLFFFLALSLQPSDPQSRVIFLYSAPRFAEMLIALSVAGIATWGLKKEETLTKFFKKEITLYVGIMLFITSRLVLILLQVFAQSPDLASLAGYAEHLRPLSFFFTLIGFEIALWALFYRMPKKYTLIIWGLFSTFAVFSTLFSSSLIMEWVPLGIWAIATIILFSNTNTKPLFNAVLIALAAFTLQISLQAMARPYAIDNFYFQKWSSEKMMASVPLKDLQSKPLQTLAHVHTKPPGFAAIRAIFVSLWGDKDPLTALRHVDFLIYQFHAVLYSLLGAITFLWLQKKTNIYIALIATFALLIHPATLLYTTLLDSNFLTAFLVLIFYYLLWKMRNKEKVSIIALILTVLALFFTRSVFQYPFIVVAGIALFMMKLPPRKLTTFLLITIAVAGLFGVQHYQKLGTISTSSFTGLNLNRSVGNTNYTDYWNLDIDYQTQDDSLPKTLTRTRKTDGSPNYNHIQYLQYNQELIEDFKAYFFSAPLPDLLKTYWENLTIYFQPSNLYHTEHAIVDRLPWRGFYEAVFSAPILPALLIIVGLYAGKKVITKKNYLPTIGFLLPALYIFAVTVLFEKGENMRFKFFIEPLFFIFIVSQLYEIVTQRKTQPTQDKR